MVKQGGDIIGLHLATVWKQRMGILRPGTKVRFWTPGFKNRPDISPPGLLRLVSVLSFLSVVGVLLYAIGITLTSLSFVQADPIEAAYIATLHFILPICIFYTVSTNSVLSRPLIGVYFATLYVATVGGVGFLGQLPIDNATKFASATFCLILVAWWLLRSARMRLYYALIANRPVPVDLAGRVDELTYRYALSPVTRARIDWIIEHMETMVILGFIVVVLIAFSSMS